MTENTAPEEDKKAAMKALRESRREWIKTATGKMKAQNKALRAIKEQLREKPRTVPEMAQNTGISPAETLWYLAAMKKYGLVREAEKDGSYFKYELTEEEA